MKALRKRRILLALAATVALAAIVSACGGGGSSSGSSTAATSPADRVDQAFVAEMIPHHELAVEMAEVAQEQGEHSQVGELADSIVESQGEEIEEMKPIAAEIGASEGDGVEGEEMEGMSESGMEEGASAAMSEDAKTLGLKMGEMGMSMSSTALVGARPFDRAFITMMTPHHEGAITMAEAELAKGEDPQLRDLAKRIIAAQEREVREMGEWYEEWYGGPVPQTGME